MFISLRRFLYSKKYERIQLQETKTGHYKFIARINNIEGIFILDTGASNSCLDFGAAFKFKLKTEESEVKAAGAGAINLSTLISRNNKIEINNWNRLKIDLVLFDLSHVNQALKEYEIDVVDGIIGADLLKNGKAVIDYQYSCFYLKL